MFDFEIEVYCLSCMCTYYSHNMTVFVYVSHQNVLKLSWDVINKYFHVRYIHKQGILMGDFNA